MYVQVYGGLVQPVLRRQHSSAGARGLDCLRSELQAGQRATLSHLHIVIGKPQFVVHINSASNIF